MSDKFLNIKQVSKILHFSEEEIEKLVKESKLPHYKIAGQFIRFKEDEVLGFRDKMLESEGSPSESEEDEDYEYTFTEKLVDFLYFNDFYILAILAIFLILSIILLEVF